MTFHPRPTATSVLACAVGVVGLALTYGAMAAVRTLTTAALPESDVPFVVLGERVFFAADDGEHGLEPWVSDGTPEGTRMLADLRPGKDGSAPHFAPDAFEGAVYFGADDGIHGRELWRSDGSPAGTALVADLQPGAVGSSPAHFAVLGARLHFAAEDTTHGRELWSVGGAGPALRVEDLCTGACGSQPQRLTVSGDRLYFAAYSVSSGWEFAVSDGTAAGTLIIDLNPGPLDSDARQFSPITTSRVMLVAFTPLAGDEVWLSDGTAAGTRLLGDIEPGTASPLAELEPLSSAVLVGASTAGLGRELWRCTPALGGYCGLLRDIDPGGDAGVFELTRVPHPSPAVYFAASTATYGRELWRSDGTQGGTWLVRDLVPGTGHGAPRALTHAGGRLVFVAGTGVGSAYQFWTSDGTPAGTRRLDPATLQIPPEGVTALGERFVFVDLRIADGTVSRTARALTHHVFHDGFESRATEELP